MDWRLHRTICLEFRSVPRGCLTDHLARISGAAVCRLSMDGETVEVESPLLWEPPDRVLALHQADTWTQGGRSVSFPLDDRSARASIISA